MRVEFHFLLIYFFIAITFILGFIRFLAPYILSFFVLKTTQPDKDKINRLNDERLKLFDKSYNITDT